jgi:hypothetical protein
MLDVDVNNYQTEEELTNLKKEISGVFEEVLVKLGIDPDDKYNILNGDLSYVPDNLQSKFKDMVDNWHDAIDAIDEKLNQIELDKEITDPSYDISDAF